MPETLVAEESSREADWERSEKRSFWIALAIALAPIPVALVVSWGLGAPPWRPKPATPAVQQGHEPVHGGLTPHR